MKAAIAIPRYREELSELENVSLAQVIKVLGHYDIFWVIPKSMKNIIKDDFEQISFADEYFSSTSAYNNLMLSEHFYSVFNKYEYILIYQLDCFVFYDKLDYFCNLGYDYIGAPWPRGCFYYNSVNRCVWHVGNGGLSLRNTQACIRLIKSSGERDIISINEDIFFAKSDSEIFKVAPFEIALEFSIETHVRECIE